MKIILASASPRRREILSKFKDIEFEVRPSYIDERIDGIASPELYVTLVAERKAEAVFQSGEIVLGADTVVVLDGVILGKPATRKDAFQMLKSLSGRKHSVITGVCFYLDNKVVYGYEKTIVEFNDISAEQIEEYISSGKCYDKAGGYGIQDEEIMKITKGIEGSLSNVIGLPEELIEKLLGEGF